MNNDPHAWLARIGIGKNVSKAEEASHVNVKSHTRAKPGKGAGKLSPTYSGGPDGKPNPAMAGGSSASKPLPMNAERAPGAATAASRAKSGAKAKSASVESGESSAYEKMEKTAVGHFAEEKVLRAGHNTGNPRGKDMKLGGGGRFAKLKASIAKKGKVKDPGAVAAAIGRKKYGSKRMNAMSAAGRKRSAY